MLDRDRLYIGGEWVAPACPDKIAVVDSTTEDVMGAVPGGTGADVERAVRAAREPSTVGRGLRQRNGPGT